MIQTFTFFFERFLLKKTHFLCHVSDKESISMTSTGLYANQTCTNKSVFKRNLSKNICVKACLSDFTFSFVIF